MTDADDRDAGLPPEVQAERAKERAALANIDALAKDPKSFAKKSRRKIPPLLSDLREVYASDGAEGRENLREMFANSFAKFMTMLRAEEREYEKILAGFREQHRKNWREARSRKADRKKLILSPEEMKLIETLGELEALFQP